MAAARTRPNSTPLGVLSLPSAAPGLDLAELIAQAPGVQALRQQCWSFDTGDGRNLEITADGPRLRFFGVLDPTRVYDDEHGVSMDDDDANAPLYDAIEALVRPIQTRTRAELELSTGDDIRADAPCGYCRALCFFWEEVCPVCHQAVTGPEAEVIEGSRDPGCVELRG